MTGERGWEAMHCAATRHACHSGAFPIFFTDARIQRGKGIDTQREAEHQQTCRGTVRHKPKQFNERSDFPPRDPEEGWRTGSQR